MVLYTIILSLCFLATDVAAEQPETVKHQVTGLFSKERIDDLKIVFREELPEISLAKVDFDRAEITVKYNKSKVFPNATEEEIIKRFDNMIRNASNHTLGIKPLCTKPREEMELIKIPVVGLDCKACCLAAYESVYRIDGVEQATASFRDGLVTAWIDPQKTDLKVLKEALLKKGVKLPQPASAEDTPSSPEN